MRRGRQRLTFEVCQKQLSQNQRVLCKSEDDIEKSINVQVKILLKLVDKIVKGLCSNRTELYISKHFFKVFIAY